jgi:hypothetical protein
MKPNDLFFKTLPFVWAKMGVGALCFVGSINNRDIQ